MAATPVVVFVWLLVASPATAPAASPYLVQIDARSGGRALQDPPPPPPQEKQKPKTTKVTGRVKDAEGRPVAKAQVVIEGRDDEDFERETWTNEDGAFEFTGPDGRYRITIKAGEKQKTAEATIGEGRLNPGEFTLR